MDKKVHRIMDDFLLTEEKSIVAAMRRLRKRVDIGQTIDGVPVRLISNSAWY